MKSRRFYRRLSLIALLSLIAYRFTVAYRSTLIALRLSLYCRFYGRLSLYAYRSTL